MKQTDKNLEGIEQALTRSEQFIEDHQKTLTYVLGGLILVLLIVVGGNRYYLKPLNEEASADMFYAERFFEMDSFNVRHYCSIVDTSQYAYIEHNEIEIENEDYINCAVENHDRLVNLETDRKNAISKM